MNSNDFGNNIEISCLGFCLIEWLIHVLGDTIVRAEVGACPFLEVCNDSSLRFVAGGLLSRPGEWGEVSRGTSKDSLFVGAVEGPGAGPLDRDVELSGVIVHS